MSIKENVKIFLASVFLIFLFIPETGMADSSIVDTNIGYSANDILTNYYIGGYDVIGNTTYAWANNSLQVINNTTGTTISDWGTPDYGGTTYWNSFVTADSSGGAYVGFTMSGNTDDRIYYVDSSGTWTQVATMAGNYDMQIYNGNLYVSGLNSTDWSDPNSIWLLDTSGSNDHDLIVEMIGNSAGLAFDSSGNAYYASYAGYGSEATLYKWDAADITGATGSSYLTYTDGTQLVKTELGANDITVDDAGNVIFNGNGSYSYIAVWNGADGDDYNYDYIATGSFNWLTSLDSEGNSLYQADYYYYGMAEINVVPIPGSVLLLGSGLLGLLGIRRRRADI